MSVTTVGINVVSLLPWSMMFPLGWGFDVALRIQRAAGYDGIQYLPLRGYKRRIYPSHPDVISYEDAWNSGPLYKALLRMLGITSHPAPTLTDWLLFDQAAGPNFYSALHCVHEFPNRWLPTVLVEMHPELDSAIATYKRLYEEKGIALVFDTFHMRRSSRSHHGTLGDWRLNLDMLPPLSIGMVHVQPYRGIDDGFLTGRPSELAQMLCALGKKLPQGSSVPYIVEFPPVFGLSYRRTVEHFENVRSRVLEAIHG